MQTLFVFFLLKEMYVALEHLIFLAHVTKYLDTTRVYGVKMP